MATRSLIGMVTPDGGVTYIYCHSDSYPTHNGALLHEHYQQREKIQQLMELGDLSSLGEQIGEKHDFDWMSKAGSGPLLIQSWDEIRQDPRYLMCKAYGRDRGEVDVEAKFLRNAGEFWFEVNEAGMGCEFGYLFGRDGEWRVWANYRSRPAEGMLLRDVLRSTDPDNLETWGNGGGEPLPAPKLEPVVLGEFE